MDGRQSPGMVVSAFLMPHPPVILGEVGKGREVVASATIAACKAVAKRIAELKPETLVIVSPHAPLFSDFVFVYDSPILSGSLARFGAPALAPSCPQDTGLRTALVDLLGQSGISAGTIGSDRMDKYGLESSLDHGVLVPLCFALEALGQCHLVALAPVSGRREDALILGQCISAAAVRASRRVCVIASGDMSHRVNAESPYGMVREGAVFDARITEALAASNIPALLDIEPSLAQQAGECGYRSILAMAGLFERPHSRLISYEAPFGIGYCVAEMYPERSNGGSHGNSA